MRLPAISLRTIILLVLALGLPILALPTFAYRMALLLGGSAPGEVSRPAAGRPLQQVIEPQVVERVSPASFEELIPDADAPRRLPHEGLDALAAEPPPLAPPPVFPPLLRELSSLDQPSAAADAPLLGPNDLSRLATIRQELENLGAEYILLETTDGTGTYRFHCQMAVDGKSSYTRQFEATADNPLVAAEQVLRDATAWREQGKAGTIGRGPVETR